MQGERREGKGEESPRFAGRDRIGPRSGTVESDAVSVAGLDAVLGQFS